MPLSSQIDSLHLHSLDLRIRKRGHFLVRAEVDDLLHAQGLDLRLALLGDLLQGAGAEGVAASEGGEGAVGEVAGVD